MTLLPSDKFDVKGWEGNHYQVNEICAHPRCNRRSVHGHHMWPRSFLRSQPQDWVRLPDGTIVGNRIGLCLEHHEMVTGEVEGYRARLVWEAGIMWWEIKVTSAPAATGADIGNTLPIDQWVRTGPLDPQPPVASRVEVTTLHSEKFGDQETIVGAVHGHVSRDEEAVCPVCGHHKRVQEPKAKLERRNTQQWVVTVPDDAEVGADVLDGMIEDLAIPLGASEWSSRLRRYYVLVAALAWVEQNRGEFIHDLAEAADRRLAS